MAGDWIKVEHTLPEKPEIDQLADALGMEPDAVVGKLVRLWVWADQHSLDGNAVSVTEKGLDRRLGREGFAAALRKVGWLEGRDAALSFPNFSRHNGQTAKSRALTRNRVEKSRGGECNAATVTGALPEKRREEVREREKIARAEFPWEAEVIAYGKTLHPPATETFCRAWWSEMEGAGWFDRQKRPVHPTGWKHTFAGSHNGSLHYGHEKTARPSLPQQKPKPKGNHI